MSLYKTRDTAGFGAIPWNLALMAPPGTQSVIVGGPGPGTDWGGIWKGVVGGSLFDFFQTKQQIDVAKMWGFAPPYMAAYQQAAGGTGSSFDAVLPWIMGAGAIALIVVLVRK